jgi:membrane-bound serine protease (ClpP class)
VVAIGLVWLIGRKGMEAIKMKPSQDLKRLIGQIGEARTDIKNTGTVYLTSEEWSARSLELIHAGAQVKVIDREGLVLMVEPYKETKK